MFKSYFLTTFWLTGEFAKYWEWGTLCLPLAVQGQKSSVSEGYALTKALPLDPAGV